MRPAALRLAAFAALADAVAARCEGLEEWLYESPDWAPPGYHVLCAERGPGSTSFELFRGGHSGRKVQWDSKISSMSSLRKQLEKKAHMKWQNMWKVLPWLLADTSGVPVQDPSAVQGLLLLFEGGRWVWPGIRENFQRRVALPLPKGQEMNVTLKTLTLDPLSFTIEDFFDKASAERMIQLAKPKLRPAEILTQDSQKENAEDLGVEVRTCWETWLSPADGPDLENVAQRSAALVRVPRELQADFRVLRYEAGQHFGAHTDYYEPEDFQEQPEVLNELQNGRNWLVTVYLYLSTVTKGGATYFPSSYGGPLPSDVLNCEGPAVKPRRGRALMFYSLHPNGRPNLSSMHGACKVEKGVKYTINIWTFNQLKPEFSHKAAKKGKGEKKRAKEL